MIDFPSVKVRAVSITVDPSETFESTCDHTKGETDLQFFLNRNYNGNHTLSLNINDNQCYIIDWQVAKSILELIKPTDSK